MRFLPTGALLLGLSCGTASAQEILDLTVDPKDVASERRSKVILGPARTPERAPGVAHRERGWRLRPEADLDLRSAEGADAAGGSALHDLKLDLESMGLRLQRTW